MQREKFGRSLRFRMAVLLGLVGTGFLYAQAPALFTYSDEPQSTMDSKTQGVFQERLREKTNAVVRRVNVNMGSLASESISLPVEAGKTLTVRRKSLDGKRTKEVWIGAATDGSTDEIVIVSNGMEIAGSVRCGGKLYTIDWIGNGVYLLNTKTLKSIDECGTK